MRVNDREPIQSSPRVQNEGSHEGGRFKATDGGNYFAFADMLPRGGWDGRIRFVKFGDPPPGDAAAAQRPGAEDGGEAEGEEGSEF